MLGGLEGEFDGEKRTTPSTLFLTTMDISEGLIPGTAVESKPNGISSISSSGLVPRQ